MARSWSTMCKKHDKWQQLGRESRCYWDKTFDKILCVFMWYLFISRASSSQRFPSPLPFLHFHAITLHNRNKKIVSLWEKRWRGEARKIKEILLSNFFSIFLSSWIHQQKKQEKNFWCFLLAKGEKKVFPFCTRE